MTAGCYVGVDIGGTKVLAGVVDDQGRVTGSALRNTPGRRVPTRLVEEALVEAVLEASAGQPLAGVGVAAAGFVDAARSRVVFAPHLPWRGERVREVIAERLGVPVELDNDANCAAVAESRHGAARGASSTIMITLGTGIGGAYLIGSDLVAGRNGMAGEFGHMRVVPDGHPCECGGLGCWEQYCSGNALVRRARELLADGDSGPLWRLSGAAPHQVTGPMVTQAALEGDPVALAAFADVGRWLGTGLAALVAALDPERVVIGGGLSSAGELLLAPARPALRSALVGADSRELPQLVVAELGPTAGLVGAAELVRGGHRRQTGHRDASGAARPDS